MTFSRENPLRIAILISGRGSNMENILSAIQSKKLPHVQCEAVISDKQSANGLKIAKKNAHPFICSLIQGTIVI